ncbi:glycosyltransferase family 39 protein [Pseudonocardia sp. CA-107938]|uniref:glycosyltransferase family 39 protein n=1 Tax=Pseudonocardia sp. CA-107938 TaxID=3240021 RepID=UPI003D913965
MIEVARHRPARHRRARPRGWTGAVVAITAGALVLRLIEIADKSLWIDEAFSWWLAQQPTAAMWRYVLAVDQHPPLYYSLLQGWLGPGDRETGLRALSVLWSVPTVPLVFLIGRRAAGPVAGLLAAVLQAVSPLHVWYAQQGRMYTMLTFFAAAATLAALHLLDTRGMTRRTVHLTTAALAASVTLTMLSHNTGVLLPVVLAVVAAVVALRQRARPRPPPAVDPDETVDLGATVLLSAPGRPRPGALALGVALGVVAWLGWLPGFLKQARQVDAEFWLPAPTGTAVVEHLRNLLSAHAPAGWTLVLAIAAVALAAGGVWRLRGRPAALLLVALVAGPLVLELLVSFRRPIFYSQTLIWTSVPLAVLAAVALTGIRRRGVAALATAALLAVNTVSLVAYYRAGSVEDWEGAALYLAGAAQPGDLVLFNAGWTRIPFDFYYAGVGPPVEERGVPVDLFERGVLEPRMTPADLPQLDGLLAGRPRVWLVYSHDWYTDPDGVVGRHLDSVLVPVGEHRFTAIDIREYRAA